MIIDMHVHSKLSLDSSASAEDYCRAIKRFRKHHPFDGFVLTEHRLYVQNDNYKRISDRYGILILQGIEVDTDLGHLLIYGVTKAILKKIDVTQRRIQTKTLIPIIHENGGIAVPSHPYRESWFGDAFEEKQEAVKDISIIEELNGMSPQEDNEKAIQLVESNGLKGIGGSDAHYVNSNWFLTCATEFSNPVHSTEDLVNELKNGEFRPIMLDNSVLDNF